MKHKHRKLFNYIPLIIIFFVYMYMPLIKGLIEEDYAISMQENRNLYTFPETPTNTAEWKNFPRKVDNYYGDHFGFRGSFKNLYFKLMRIISSSSPGKDITQGKDGWLFLGSIKPGYESYSDPMGDAMNVKLYTQDQLQQFASYLSAIKQWLALRGIEYVYIVTPQKHTIYFDQLPDYIKKKNEKSALDQLVEYLRKNTEVTIIDVRNALMQERKIHRVYYKTDSHWNSYGANVAQLEVMNHISTLFPGKIQPFKLSHEQFTMGHINFGDIAKSANLKDEKEESPVPVFDNMCIPEIEGSKADFFAPFTMVCEGEDLNALIFRDSYFSSLVPYFSRQFNKSTYIWEQITYEMLVEFVEKEKPDIVIDQVVERVLPYMPKGKPFEAALAE